MNINNTNKAVVIIMITLFTGSVLGSPNAYIINQGSNIPLIDISTSPHGGVTLSPDGTKYSKNIGYVNYDGSGFTGAYVATGNIFSDAIIGGPATTSSATTPVTYNGMTFTPLRLTDISSATLANYDTLILFEACDVSTSLSSEQHDTINTYLAAGNKILIFDGDRCAAGYGGKADYSWFIYPFSTSSPGPMGERGILTIVEDSTLTNGLASDPFDLDELGDANTAVTNDSHWFAAAKTTNALGNNGFFLAYARNKGLVIYNGADYWYSYYPTKSLTDLFINELNQQYDPDNLPGTTPIVPANITVERVWTMDINNQDKTLFSPGDDIHYGVMVNNTGSSTLTATFDFLASGPNGIIYSWTGPGDVPSGIQYFYSPSTIPTNAPAGTYDINITVTYNGVSSSDKGQFVVESKMKMANIILPVDNSYSEESVNFSGTANGGTPPYAYIWTSDIDGILGTTPTFDTSNKFNKKLTMGAHNISLTVQDSAGNIDIETVTLNVVRKIMEVFVIPTNFASYDQYPIPTDIPSDEITNIGKQTYKYYLDASYGTVYLDFKVLDKITINDKSYYDKISDENERKLAILTNVTEILKKNKFSFKDSQMFAIDLNIPRYVNPQAWTDPRSLVINRENNYSDWTHEIGHALLNLPDMYGGTYGNVWWWDIMGMGNQVVPPTQPSSFNKLLLNWLKPDPISYGELPAYVELQPLEKSRYGEGVRFFKVGDNISYIIEARDLPKNSINNNICQATIKSVCDGTLENGVVIYKVENFDLSSGLACDNWKVNFISNGFLGINKADPTLSTVYLKETYMDGARFVKFTISSAKNVPYYQPTVKIEGIDFSRMVGSVLNNIKINIPRLSNIFPISSGNMSSPDLDLHAYTSDRKHVGMNYTNGEYEIQIPGAVASGDLNNGEEWIFVPIGTQVTYSVDSHDVKKFLEENPYVNPANATANYSTISMEYGENPQRVQLPDGSWTVTNRTISTPKEGTIGPGITKTIRTTIGDADDDGTITVADALLYLRKAVEQDISPYHIDTSDDVTCDGKTTVADALLVLRKSVGQNVNLQC